MKIYYYHTRPIQEALDEWNNKRHPGHILYGLPLFPRLGIQCILHQYRFFGSRFMLMLYTTKEVLLSYKHYQAIYGTSFRGLELIIFLRAMGIFRKPIICWHHTAVTASSKKWKERLSRVFYRGIDKMFFFSKKLIDDSIKSKKVDSHKLQLIHWGPDIPFYDNIMSETPTTERNGFISTGKENRDIATLLKAFASCQQQLDVYIPEACGPLRYKDIVENIIYQNNIQVHYTDGIIPYELAKLVAQKSCIVIPCLDFSYTIGLTTLVEAWALGIPVISTRNPNFEIDIDKEGIGITVAYGDVKGWIDAIEYLSTHPTKAQEMGKKARLLAEQRFNLDIFSREIADTILTYHKK